MTRGWFGRLIDWIASLFRRRPTPVPVARKTPPSMPPAAPEALDPIDPGEEARVRALERQVAEQTDETILQESARLGPLIERCLLAARPHLVPAARVRDVADAVVAMCRREGLAPAVLGYNGFPAPIGISINDEITNGLPSSRELRQGDLVKIEFAVVSGKAFAALSWTFVVGRPSSADATMLAAGREALTKAIATIVPRSRVGDIGAAIQSTAEAAGLSVIRLYIGYGMGKQHFQAPQIPGTGAAGSGARLRPGTVLNIHVILKQGTAELEISPNGWTSFAVDGGRGVLFTAMVQVTAEGHTRLTTDLDA